MTEAHLKKLPLTLVVAYERTYLDATIVMTLLSPKTAVAGSYSIVENQEADAWRLSFPRCLPKAHAKKTNGHSPVTSGRSMMNVG